MNNSDKTAVVTGANSGLGFEAAAQLADQGYGKVILACRSIEKANAAKAQLVQRVGKDVFEGLVIDTSEPAKGRQAAQELIGRGGKIDYLLLNAGMGGTDLKTNSDGIDLVYASTLAGHHVLTIELLNGGLLADEARIVIAGSEAARGDITGMPMKTSNFRGISEAKYGGDMLATLIGLAKGEAESKYDSNVAYSNAKAMVAWWAAALARRLPEKMAVYAVSPGAAMSTAFARNMPWAMRVLLVPVMRVIGPVVGMDQPIDVAARRYLDVVAEGVQESGSFFASPPKKVVGPLQKQLGPDYLLDEDLQEAGWAAVVAMTGNVEVQAVA